ncbi:MAG: alpha-amylase family glycosyl hydrolase [Promethearchaeota archaeon]
MTLGKILDALERKSYLTSSSYYIPSLWKDPSLSKSEILKVNPFDFYVSKIKNILDSPHTPLVKGEGQGDWSKNAVIYNIFVRVTTAFDHNQNGQLDLNISKDEFRETGTFLKTIALLPYIKYLGANTIHLLPITTVGEDGKKGTIGSPYAIKNPYQLNPNLAEPILQLDVNTEFIGLVEAAHHLGMRVIVEFVLRTAAKDCDWIKDHPDWFYWIKADIKDRISDIKDENHYGNPIFSQNELDQIKKKVAENDFDSLIPPHETYKRMFTESPPLESINKIGTSYFGTLPDGTRVRIPGAFADWPPDDTQPPWEDVTYFKLHKHSDFNYIAYNTVRMYDSRLEQSKYATRPLWEKIVGIIPYFQKKFGIDGVLLDMGHSLPSLLKKSMITEARRINPDFAFWDEKFDLDEDSRKSRKEGYNAIVGNYWWIGYRLSHLWKFLQDLDAEEPPIPFFVAPETHNTPRVRARKYGSFFSKSLWVLGCLLPGIPFIHSGFELQETYPINTGLDFTLEELKEYSSEKLPLFSEHAYNWTSENNLTGWIRAVLKIRQEYEEIIIDPDPNTLSLLKTGNTRIIGIKRVKNHSLRIYGFWNTNFESSEWLNTPLEDEEFTLRLLVGEETYEQGETHLRIKMNPGSSVIFCANKSKE